MYLLYICFDDSLVVYTVNLRVQNKLGKKAKISFHRSIVCLNFTKDHTNHDLLQIKALVLRLNFLNC